MFKNKIKFYKDPSQRGFSIEGKSYSINAFVFNPFDAEIYLLPSISFLYEKMNKRFELYFCFLVFEVGIIIGGEI